ncbi:SAM-dependent methyltransferase [Salmonella enterica subsp. enterica]|nr:SAM-dependent methyltransferase [Salmonella enterica subsp. enterica]
MDISAVIFATHRIRLLPDESKIPWDEPAFSQRMLENHLSQDHDWASRRLTVIEQQVTWITRQLPAGARILDLGCGPRFLYPPVSGAWVSLHRRRFLSGIHHMGSPAGASRKPEY